MVWFGGGVLEEGRASCRYMCVDGMSCCVTRAVVDTGTHTTRFPGDCLSICGALHRTPCSSSYSVIHQHVVLAPHTNTACRQKKKFFHYPYFGQPSKSFVDTHNPHQPTHHVFDSSQNDHRCCRVTHRPGISRERLQGSAHPSCRRLQAGATLPHWPESAATNNGYVTFGRRSSPS